MIMQFGLIMHCLAQFQCLDTEFAQIQLLQGLVLIYCFNGVVRTLLDVCASNEGEFCLDPVVT